ncbi:MAG: hypothetical protein FJ225_09855 [Lentisphaerae bacterium]|nr:hypothetical protein [Lentisphaerota bacterium]
MKKAAARRLVCPFLFAVALALAGAPSRAQTAAPSASKAQFDKIVTRLDQGGDILVVANIQGVIEESVGSLINMMELGAGSRPENAAFAELLRKLPSFLQANGFYAVDGLGYSSVPRADGLHKVKLFLSRDASASALPLWRGLMGVEQRESAALRFAPPDTALARTSAAELKQLWALTRAAVRELASPEAAAQFSKSIDGLTPVLGTPLDALIDSLGADMLFSVQLSRETTFAIPSPEGGEPTRIPTPSVLIAVAVTNTLLADTIEQKIKTAPAKPDQPAPVTETRIGATVVRTLNAPAPAPFPVQPTFAQHKNFFLFGSTTDAVVRGIKSFEGGSGLVASAEFKTAFEDLPMANNALLYLSPRLGELLRELQKNAIERSGARGTTGAAVAMPLQRLLEKGRPLSISAVVMNWKSGVVVQGVTSLDGRHLIAASPFTSPAAVGMLAAMAIPSFVKARGTSRQNACINNLRMIDAAKEQWALENNKVEGEEASLQGICEYIKGNALPLCPAGGTYTVGAIGANPTCSHPGHALR